MVGVTGLEPATSRPPAVRATNCATPRYIKLRVTVSGPAFPCETQVGLLNILTTVSSNLGNPLKSVQRKMNQITGAAEMTLS